MAERVQSEELRKSLSSALSAQTAYTSTSLAKALGRDGTYLRDFLNGKKDTLGAAEITEIERLLDVALMPKVAPAANGQTRKQPPIEVALAPDAPSFDRLGGARDVPEYGIAVGGEEGDFTLNGEVVGYVTRPLSLRGRNVFAVRVKGSSMQPRFDEGDVLYVERHREPAIGDDGIFEMKPNDEWEAGHAFIKQLVSKGMGIVTVRQFNPEREFPFKREEIARMYRVVPRNELLSV